MPPTPSPSPTPTPTDGSWLTIHGPLIVLPDGGWQVLISLLALVVSLSALWFTLSARAVVHAIAARVVYRDPKGREVFDGYDVTVFNTGRGSAIITDIDMETADGGFISPAFVPRGTSRKTVDFPTLPLTLAAQSSVMASFPNSFGDVLPNTSGRRIRVLYLRPARFGRPSKPGQKFVDPRTSGSARTLHGHYDMSVAQQ